MPRMRVIFLDQDPTNQNTYNILFWADVPAARVPFYVDANAKSAWAQATATDNQALQNGTVVEKQTIQTFPAGTNMNQIENYLQNEWQKYQNNVNGFNPWIHYGTTWDGTTWNLITGA